MKVFVLRQRIDEQVNGKIVLSMAKENLFGAMATVLKASGKKGTSLMEFCLKKLQVLHFIDVKMKKI